MNRYLFAIVIILSSFKLVHGQDIIVKHDGSKLNGKVNYITESTVVYTEPENSNTSKLGKAEVEKIIYKSGRIEPISQKVEIHGQEDWQKIILTTNPLLVVGLMKKGEIKVKSGRQGHGMANFESHDMEKMKKQAAGMGAHVLVVDGYDGRAEFSNQKTETVVAYGYK
ncbi:hypothetical protein L0657_12495 [Dyadobacter sp. CY345]|uniref:hypothetical protein n=1 Tax=Dyadobacter sp. CY345 TaxID=2909335 RepID=UPI001F173FDA|nr:hypothetical protein [Dyadobacter sp. CY345]MCF2444779.1 hypothetical protein [Dyadobacter sp. CY345]